MEFVCYISSGSFSPGVLEVVRRTDGVHLGVSVSADDGFVSHYLDSDELATQGEQASCSLSQS